MYEYYTDNKAYLLFVNLLRIGLCAFTTCILFVSINIICYNIVNYLKIYGKLYLEKITKMLISLICINKCNICLEPVIFCPQLNLECKCKYTVHYSCYNTWWKSNKTCIICRTKTNYKPKINNYENFIITKKYKKFINMLTALIIVILGHLLLELLLEFSITLIYTF